MWAAVVPRVRPKIAPRAYGSQCGAPRPTNAGTTTTPSESGTLAASFSTSTDDLMTPSPSRSHCTTAPAMKTEPSRQYVVLPPTCQPTVVSSLCFDWPAAYRPMFSSMKQPVP